MTAPWFVSSIPEISKSAGGSSTEKQENLPIFCFGCSRRVSFFTCLDHMLQHLSRGENILCTECSANLRNKDDVVAHLKCFVAEARRPPTTHFACQQCGYRALDEWRLHYHRMWSHPSHQQPSPLGRPLPPTTNLNSQPRRSIDDQDRLSTPRSIDRSILDRDRDPHSRISESNTSRTLKLVEQVAKRLSSEQGNGQQSTSGSKKLKIYTDAEPEKKEVKNAESSTQTEAVENKESECQTVSTEIITIDEGVESVGVQTEENAEEKACEHCGQSTKKKIDNVLGIVDQLSKSVDLMQKALNDVKVYLNGSK